MFGYVHIQVSDKLGVVAFFDEGATLAGVEDSVRCAILCPGLAPANSGAQQVTAPCPSLGVYLSRLRLGYREAGRGGVHDPGVEGGGARGGVEG